MKLFKTILLATLFLLPTLAQAQAVGPLNVSIDNDLLSPQRLFQIITLVTVLSVAPSLLLMVTSFTRIIIVFSFLRSAIGLQSSPPNAVLVTLALFLTSFIMMPTFQQSYQQGIGPYLNQQITEEQAFTRSTQPFARFMLANVREFDLSLFISLLPEAEQKAIVLPAPNVKPEAVKVPLQALVPAFMISELRRAFEIGFLLFLPFLVIDLAVASILMSMGMMMLPPVTVALPFKIIFFVLIDGWHLLTGTLIQSFQTPI
ncbi:MAG: flagellar biosynthetic protein FliP [Proteobacteria bacterium]|nr:flagellar biosynthetic protein FliP [Pseudomonadota bacterium]NBX86853.1 flagellar biosynthetic protein FliP [Pseudomonadota bacterium]